RPQPQVQPDAYFKQMYSLSAQQSDPEPTSPTSPSTVSKLNSILGSGTSSARPPSSTTSCSKVTSSPFSMTKVPVTLGDWSGGASMRTHSPEALHARID